MDVKHARSPVIKVIVGDDEDFVDTAEGRIQPNVFYVHKSFLVHHSRYFKTLFDSALPHDDTVVRLQLPEGCDYEMFASWLTVLYLSKEALTYFACVRGVEEISSLFAIASFLGSSSSKNLLLDAIQRDDHGTTWCWSPLAVKACRGDDAANKLFYDYVLECVAYSILKDGGEFESSRSIYDYIFTNGDPGGEYGDSVDQSNSLACFEKVMARVGELWLDERQGKLKNPGKRKDCKWHEHTDQDRIECPRYGDDYNPRR